MSLHQVWLIQIADLMQIADMSEQDEVSQTGPIPPSNIVLHLVRKNCTSSSDAAWREGRETCQTEKSFEAERKAKEEAVESDGDPGNDEKTEEEKQKREERRKGEEQIRLRKEQRKREEEERKRAKREEKRRTEQEAKAKEEEVRALEEEARMKTEAEEARRREQRELEELAGMLRKSLEVEEAERQALAEEEELRLREEVVEATRKENKRKVTGERSRRPTMAREWRMLRQRRRSQEELRAKVESESPLLSDVQLPKPTKDNREELIIRQNFADGCYAEKAPDGCYAEKVPNCCYVEHVRGEEELKQMARGEL